MPRVLVTTQTNDRAHAPVLLDEYVFPANLEDDHAAAQLIERIAWAVSDAVDEERERPHHGHGRRGAHAQTRRRR
jgi:hypothetical protein